MVSPMVLYTFMVSMVTPRYILTSDALELGTRQWEPVAFVFLGLGYLTQCLF